MYKSLWKRVLDFFLAGTGLVVLLPLFLLLAFCVKFDSAGPVFLKQKRLGKDKKVFRMYKFRTMRPDAPAYIPTYCLLGPERYITRFGRFLRRFSLDELPQLFNVARGEMSLIGPRPALWNEYSLIAERDKYGANGILPGLSGLAQVSGRDDLSVKAKAMLDGEYLRNISFCLDAKCFFKTFGVVLSARGVVEGVSGGRINPDQTGASPS
ncbi:MAG: sugar transferase [Acidaminococcales bacterium]|nr:sugar transferase [Acidaminococcales bacterium]